MEKQSYEKPSPQKKKKHKQKTTLNVDPLRFLNILNYGSVQEAQLRSKGYVTFGGIPQLEFRAVVADEIRLAQHGKELQCKKPL